MTKEELLQLASLLENQTYYPMGRYEDGAVYTAMGRSVWDFMHMVTKDFGDGDFEAGTEYLRNKIIERKSRGEVKADPDCGNWRLWVIFNELNVSRIRE